MIFDLALMPTIRIEVTARDIADGMRKSCEWCPIAVAARRALQSHPYLRLHSVFPDSMGFHVGARWRIDFMPTPSVAARFARDFDAGSSLGPFSFDQPIPLDPSRDASEQLGKESSR